MDELAQKIISLLHDGHVVEPEKLCEQLTGSFESVASVYLYYGRAGDASRVLLKQKNPDQYLFRKVASYLASWIFQGDYYHPEASFKTRWKKPRVLLPELENKPLIKWFPGHVRNFEKGIVFVDYMADFGDLKKSVSLRSRIEIAEWENMADCNPMIGCKVEIGCYDEKKVIANANYGDPLGNDLEEIRQFIMMFCEDAVKST